MTICPHCEKECSPKQIDIGIGFYEYWGQKCVDTQLIWVSDCCEEEVEDFNPSDWEDEGAIEDYEDRRETRAERYPV